MIVLRLQRVTPIVSHSLTRPHDLGETYAKPSSDNAMIYKRLLFLMP